MIIFIACILGVAFFKFHLNELLTFERLKQHQQEIVEYSQTHRLQAFGLFMGGYILVAALSLPGATILTLAGGAIFGLGWGWVAVSIASTLGATCAFLIARFFIGGWVQERFGDRLKKMNEGVKKEGAFYLLTLRLVPVFPFFIVNLLMALTPIRAFTFLWASQLGMLPGTLAYVNAGTRLSQLTSLKGILSPAILLSFAALGVVPIIAKKFVDGLRRSRKNRKFAKPAKFDYNLLVIGGGSAGLVSAYIAAAVKAKVVLIEKDKMGGDCLNRGCVPSKALIRSAKILSYSKRAGEFGFKSASVDFDFAQVMERVSRVIREVEPHDSVERYTKLGVNCVQGEATVLSPYEVQVKTQEGTRTLTAKNLILATGSYPKVPPIPGLSEIRHYTSDTIWDLRVQPRRLLVLGGGPIGCELAQAFHRLGSQVIQVERSAQLLEREDSDVSALIAEKFRAEGIQLLTDHEPVRFQKSGDHFELFCNHAGREIKVEFDEVLVALGRQARVKGFGLEALGLEITERGTIACNEKMQTQYPNVYTCGDVAGPYQFTHVAAHQAWYASVNALFRPLKSFSADYRVIPATTFVDPEVSRVGLNEKEAKAQNIACEVTIYPMADLDRAITDNETEGFVKVLTAPGTDRILGVTIVADKAAEMLPEYITAMKYGIGLNKILGTIHMYPTFAEANKYAAGNWKKAHAPEKALQMLQKYHQWRRS